jgi:hypothetical protein
VTRPGGTIHLGCTRVRDESPIVLTDPVKIGDKYIDSGFWQITKGPARTACGGEVLDAPVSCKRNEPTPLHQAPRLTAALSLVDGRVSGAHVVARRHFLQPRTTTKHSAPIDASTKLDGSGVLKGPSIHMNVPAANGLGTPGL